MEYDSESSCDGRLRDPEASVERPRPRRVQEQPPKPLNVVPAQPKVAFNITDKSLSKQVMEYYQQYSQSSNLEQYFSLPATSAETEDVKYYYSIYELNPKLTKNRQGFVGQDYNLRSYVPRERRRWARPPLIGQSSGAENPSIYGQPLTDPRTPSPELKRVTPETIPEDRNESREAISEVSERKATSPASSVASHKPLEWDSGADVGYYNALPQNKQNSKKLSTIERMALARGCSAALRLDPEGTTESGVAGKSLSVAAVPKSARKPNANSTPVPGNVSETESEVEITPIVKNHPPGVITGNDIKSEERSKTEESKQYANDIQSSADSTKNFETPKSITVFKVPSVNYGTEGQKCKTAGNGLMEHSDVDTLPLKKCSSMNGLAPVSSKLTLKRSQSELNLHAKDKCKVLLPLIFNSTSSLATVVNKPATCDKVIQTSISENKRESVGVQVSVLEDDRPPLPKRGTSLAGKSIHSILKNSKNTVAQDSRMCNNDCRGAHRKNDSGDRSDDDVGVQQSSTEMSQNDSRPLTPHPDDTENVTGRANSFEYFPGHIYENVPNGSASHVSSVDTGRSNSTMPNTSSSIDEKLWGDSDSLVRDLERSVNILRSLVDANKCDRQVKKRLIHHVVKRLVTAKYTDDKIEHNLEENVPWNPDDARKVYRADIIQALTKKQNTTDSSEEWKPQKKKTTASLKKQTDEEVGIITLESSNSDKFEGHTDRTEMDGRKARMGLRTDDCRNSSNTPTDANKSESSECFLPQRRDKVKKMNNIYCLQKKSDPGRTETTMSNTLSDRNRILLEAVVNNRQSPMESSNGTRNSVDWRLPTTLSERQFELRRCNNSESGDSKLVSYAEMEKKNQLIWITNEISHLSNLKKLLEEPKKMERSRSSPKKTKHAISKQKPLTVLTCICGQDSIPRETPDVCGGSVNEQWSSHCNLATCHPATDATTKSFKRLGKRNSCTQTATDVVKAHSKTGGEILSVVAHQGPEVKLTNVLVQTSSHPRSLSPPLSLQRQVVPQAACPIHSQLYPRRCKCVGQTCQCRRRSPVQLPQNAQRGVCLCRTQTQSRPSSFSSVCHRVTPSSCPDSTNERHFVSQKTFPNLKNRVLVEFSKQKEAKNKLNATKSKCDCNREIPRSCQCIRECTCEMKRAGKDAAMCKLCCKRIAQLDANAVACDCEECKNGKLCDRPNYCTCEKKQTVGAKTCGCPGSCDCENKQNDPAQGNGKGCDCCGDCHCEKNAQLCNFTNQRSDGKLCECPKDCTCKTKQADGAQPKTKTCECCSDCNCENEGPSQYDCLCYPQLEVRKGQIQPYYLINSQEDQIPQASKVQNSQRCGCGKDCSCGNRAKDIQLRLYSPKRGLKTSCSCESRAIETNRSSKCCRSCGSSYQNGRECGCRLNYPKPVAYELSFGEENQRMNADVCFSKHQKVEMKPLPKAPSSASTPNTAKSCSCEDGKTIRSPKASSNKKTLQDYLASNKPGFVNSIETRRQCMSEISQLRELRKEKRVQLLAMASSSSIAKTPRSAKPTVCKQRRISEAEMKERLRKRYSRLNEVRTKRKQREKEEEARRNKLMATIFCKKLQQKVLKGQVDLSHSVSVISNL